jgi:hypothetical protein
MDASTKPPTLAEALAQLGCSHRPSKWQGKRNVYRGEALVGAMNAKEGWVFVYQLRQELEDDAKATTTRRQRDLGEQIGQ